jgi:hypothetical protein
MKRQRETKHGEWNGAKRTREKVIVEIYIQFYFSYSVFLFLAKTLTLLLRRKLLPLLVLFLFLFSLSLSLSLIRIQFLDGSCDELLHDLVSSTVDSLDTSITVRIGDIIVFHESPTTVHLNTVVSDLALKISHGVLVH